MNLIWVRFLPSFCFCSHFCCWHSLLIKRSEKHTDLCLCNNLHVLFFFLTSCEANVSTNKQSLVFDASLAFQRTQWISWSPVGGKHYRKTKNLLPVVPGCCNSRILFHTRSRMYSAAHQPSFFCFSKHHKLTVTLNNLFSNLKPNKEQTCLERESLCDRGTFSTTL